MQERMTLHGTPCTLVVQGHVRLPGDELVPIDFELKRDGVGRPVLLPRLDAIAGALVDRAIEGR